MAPEHGRDAAGRRPARPARILIVDDHQPLRLALRSLVETMEGFEPVGEANCGEQSIPLVETFRPDIVLMDVEMPGMGGIAAAREISSSRPATIVVLLSSEGADAAPRRAWAGAAVGLVAKERLDAALLRDLWRTHGSA